METECHQMEFARQAERSMPAQTCSSMRMTAAADAAPAT